MSHKRKVDEMEQKDDIHAAKIAGTNVLFPRVGLGTWQAPDVEVKAAVKAAIDLGYRHIDCASNYLNEAPIGDQLAETDIARDKLWITGKLNNPYHRKQYVRPHLEKTLKDLNVDYLDLWLMHWPVGFVHVPYDANKRGFDVDYDPDGCSNVESVKNGGSKIDMGVSLRETWEAMEECHAAGLVKHIGLCNVTGLQVHDVLTYCKVKPAVVQNEMHPYAQQKALVRYLLANNIVPEAYSPLGAGGFQGKDEPRLLDDPLLKEIGDKHSKTAAQVALRWNVQRGCVVIPKSVKEHRIKENADIFDFELTEEEMEQIGGLDKNFHYLRPNDWYQIPHWTP